MDTRHLLRIRPLALAIALACAVVGARIGEARVFQRWGAAARAADAMEAAGGETVYNAPVRVNGGVGRLRVVLFRQRAGDVAAALRRAFGTDRLRLDGADPGLATVASDGRVTRLAILPLAEGEQTLVIHLDQSEADFQASAAPPDRHLMSAVDAFPESEPSFFAEDRRSGMSLAVSTTRSPPPAVREFFHNRLSAAGWTAPFPDSADAPVLSMPVYLRGREVCCLLVQPAAQAGTTRIALLHKDPGVE